MNRSDFIQREHEYLYHLIYYALSELGRISIKRRGKDIIIYTPNEDWGYSTRNIVDTNFIGLAEIRNIVTHVRFELSQEGKNENR